MFTPITIVMKEEEEFVRRSRLDDMSHSIDKAARQIQLGATNQGVAFRESNFSPQAEQQIGCIESRAAAARHYGLCNQFHPLCLIAKTSKHYNHCTSLSTLNWLMFQVSQHW